MNAVPTITAHNPNTHTVTARYAGHVYCLPQALVDGIGIAAACEMFQAEGKWERGEDTDHYKNYLWDHRGSI